MTIYAGERMAKYFEDPNAYNLFKNSHRWVRPSSPFPNNGLTLFDNKYLSLIRSEYFINLRSSYLLYCCNDTYICEPYSPYWVSGQFQFCQNVLNDLERNFFSLTL